MSTIVQGRDGKTNMVLLKGAPERVLEKCTHWQKSDGSAQAFKNKQETEQLLAKIKENARQGLRVLAVAIAEDGGKMKHINASNYKKELQDPARYPELEGGCSFVGFVCIRDPPRDEVKESIRLCRTAGVNVIMITGDAKETAVAIAQELEILNKGDQACYTGAEFEALSHD